MSTSANNSTSRRCLSRLCSACEKMHTSLVPSTRGFPLSSTLPNWSSNHVSAPAYKVGRGRFETGTHHLVSVYALVKFPVNRWICFCVSCAILDYDIETDVSSSSDGAPVSASCLPSPLSLVLRSSDSSLALSKHRSVPPCWLWYQCGGQGENSHCETSRTTCRSHGCDTDEQYLVLGQRSRCHPGELDDLRSWSRHDQYIPISAHLCGLWSHVSHPYIQEPLAYQADYTAPSLFPSQPGSSSRLIRLKPNS